MSAQRPDPPKRMYVLVEDTEDAVICCDTLEDAKLEAVGPAFRRARIYGYVRSARKPIKVPRDVY